MPMPKKPRTPCLNCGEEPKRFGARFCSNRCQQAYQHRESDLKILASGDTSPHLRWPRAVKAFLVRQHGHKCSICGRTKWRGKSVPLVADHINGNPDDSRVVNWRLVCGNCDMQLPTFKGKNRGSGRHSRRVRYAQGKSF